MQKTIENRRYDLWHAIVKYSVADLKLYIFFYYNVLRAFSNIYFGEDVVTCEIYTQWHILIIKKKQ